MPQLNDILAVIMGGGRGSRLYPLTKERAKPAVPIFGKYRLIDIPISNCINSGIYHIAVLTQFNSVSLHRHISRTYYFDSFHTGWVQIWAAEQTMQSADWYQGTADAVRKQLFEIRSTRAPYVLVLAGDHLYNMDYSEMARFHWEHNADITVAVQPVPRAEAPRLGILKRSHDCRIQNFVEKCKDPAYLETFVSTDDPGKPFLGSMGIYLFRTDILFDILENNAYDDFGGQVIPHAINQHAVYGYDFTGYWEDIGTIRSFFETNLQLARPNSPLDLNDAKHRLYTHPRFLPCSRVENSTLNNVFLAEGCTIRNAQISETIVGLRSQIMDGSIIHKTVLMGTDYYEEERPGPIPMGIGANCRIEGAIIDKNARLGAGVVIRSFPPGTDLDGDTYVVRDGIVVIPKNTMLPDGTYIGPKD